jgi:NDP-sugar pyrophosphorylase family protein
MQLIIPMSGSGERFRQAGYTAIKPLIPVHGRPMIEYVLNMFPGVTSPLLIAREDHLQETPLAATLQQLAPDGLIASIEPHKLGPVHAVLEAKNMVRHNEPVIVNYCDFFMRWNYAGFLSMLQQEQPHGAIPCYTGFHPHLLHKKNVYAACRVDDELNLLEIREKHRFFENPFQDHHSAGTYYFSSGRLMLDYMEWLVRAQRQLNGEYYVSMVYEQMLRDGLRIKVFNKIPHFCQWGTPEDLQEYEWWSGVFDNRNGQ